MDFNPGQLKPLHRPMGVHLFGLRSVAQFKLDGLTDPNSRLIKVSGTRNVIEVTCILRSGLGMQESPPRPNKIVSRDGLSIGPTGGFAQIKRISSTILG